MAAAHTPLNRANAAACGNKNASNVMDKSPMRLVLAKQKEAAVVTSSATEIARIRDTP